jgi:formate hydrogenlyase transcriptional activator
MLRAIFVKLHCPAICHNRNGHAKSSAPISWWNFRLIGSVNPRRGVEGQKCQLLVDICSDCGVLESATSEREKTGQDECIIASVVLNFFQCTECEALTERHMSEEVEKPQSSTLRYVAVVRISDALSACSEPQQLATILADELEHFLPFDHLHVAIFKEGSNEIEWHGWGKGPLPEPDLSVEELPGWQTYKSQEPLHLPDLNKADSFARLKELRAAKGHNSGSAVRVPLTTPHRRLGTLGIISDLGTTYSSEDIGFLQLIARVVAFAIDDGLNLKRARAAQAGLQQQNDRLQLLLNLTNSITLNLQLKDVLRAVAAHVRKVMRCDAANISLPGPEPGTFRLYALDFPGSTGFAKEEQIITETEDSPAKRAFETLKPVIATTDRDSYGRKIAAAEGIKTVCFIPLVNRGRALGNLVLARTTEDTFTQEDVEFLSQAAGQIAIAIAQLEVETDTWKFANDGD